MAVHPVERLFDELLNHPAPIQPENLGWQPDALSRILAALMPETATGNGDEQVAAPTVVNDRAPHGEVKGQNNELHA